MRFNVLVVAVSFATLFNVWVFLFPDPDRGDQFQAVWGAGMLFGLALTLVVSWVTYFRHLEDMDHGDYEKEDPARGREGAVDTLPTLSGGSPDDVSAQRYG